MGLIYAPVTIINPADASKSWEGNFLIDTGASDTLVPSPILEAIGVSPKGRREYQLADGNKIGLDTTTADIEIMGEIIGCMVVFGDPDATPLLGAIALQTAGIVVDPRKETLQKIPSMIRL